MIVARHRPATIFSRFARTAKLGLLVGVVVSGCMYRGGIDNPVVRNFTWFSYVAGDDIRERCAPGRPAQYRFVYNAHYLEQVRAYDLRRSATGEGAMLWVQVFGGEAALNSFSPFDPAAPWAGRGAERRLSEDQYLSLIRAVEASGFGEAPPAGLRLPSYNFYWASIACADGKLHFNAWRHPSDRWDRIAFDKLLFEFDPSGKPVNPPRKIDNAQQFFRAEDRGYAFELMVTRDGITGGRLPPL
jgi:hypothetical protein